MKANVFTTIATFTLLSNMCAGQKAINQQRYIDLLNNGEYTTVYEEMVAMQKSSDYGANAVTDFFIGKSLCLSGLAEKAQQRFQKILNTYKLSQNTRRLIQDEMEGCQEVAATGPRRDYNYLNNYVIPTSSLSGKLGAVDVCYRPYQPYSVINPIAEPELNARIFNTANSDDALKKCKSIIPANFDATVRGAFIFVTSKDADPDRVYILKELDSTLGFFTRYFRLRRPTNFLTVYLATNNDQLRMLGKTIHGLDIPYESYGYSMLGDLSVSGITNFLGIGTIKHELFHLAIRTDFGDIPPWLDEGVATLYEESHWEADMLKGNDHFWRNEALRGSLQHLQLFAKLPSLEQLLNYSWQEFDTENDVCRASVNYALAKHFMVYVEQTGLLQKVVSDYRKISRSDPKGSVESNVEVLEKIFRLPIEEIEVNFDNWLKKEYHFSILNPSGYSPDSSGIKQLKVLRQSLAKEKSNYKKLLLTNKFRAASLLKIIEATEKKLREASSSSDSEMRAAFEGRKSYNSLVEQRISNSFFRKISAIQDDFDKSLSNF